MKFAILVNNQKEYREVVNHISKYNFDINPSPILIDHFTHFMLFDENSNLYYNSTTLNKEYKLYNFQSIKRKQKLNKILK